MAVRIQKFLANAGLGSRRELERWIKAGEIKVNGKLAELGDQVELQDNLTIKGRFYRVVEADYLDRQVLMYHKPEGEITSQSDPEGRPSVFDRLPRLQRGRWIVVGRLDINSLGLLLFTNDGDLANALMHPSKEITRKYAVRVKGLMTPETLQSLRTGIELEDGMAHFDEIVHTGGEKTNQWYDVTLREGRNREVRRLFAAVDLMVSRLIRVSYGPINLPKWLGRGRYHVMDKTQVHYLLRAVGMDKAVNSESLMKLVAVHPRSKRRSKKR